MEVFEPEFCFLGVCSNIGNFCFVIYVLTGFDNGVTVVRVVTEFVLQKIQGFDLFALFVLSLYDAFVVCRSKCVAGTDNLLTS